LRQVVLDASVVVRWFRTPAEPTGTALRSEFESGRIAVTIPGLVFLELLNVAGRQWRWRKEKLLEFAEELDRTKFEVLDPAHGRIADWVARGLTAYDASYVALAEQLGIPLVTLDRTILDVASRIARTPGAARG
jgi:predicted nucleic acid-binding protein